MSPPSCPPSSRLCLASPLTVIVLHPRFCHHPRRVKKVIIHSDGACQGNPGPGGWAAVLAFGSRNRELSGGVPATTNNRMELQAAIAALTAIAEPCAVELHTDSSYLRDGITKWISGWKRNGWLTKTKDPVKNEDLWRQLDELIARHKLTYAYIAGHSGHVENERCDKLAVAAYQQFLRR